MKEFGQEIRRLREEMGITQQEIAEQFYVTAATVSRWESGARYPDLPTAKKLAEFYGVSLDSILDDEEFTQHAEKAPIMETDRSGNIQTCLYTIAAIAFLFRLTGFFLFPEIHDGSASARTAEILNMILSSGSLAALVSGVVLSFRTDLSPKMAGLIAIGFFAVRALLALVMNHDILSGILMAALPFACIVLLVLFFFQKKNSVFIWLETGAFLYMAASLILCFLQSETYSYTSTSYVTRYRFLWSLCEPVSVCCLMALLAWQVFSVYRKRKIAERGKTT